MSDDVQNARALLTLFARSPWQDLHVRTAAGEMFMAKPGGAANPLRGGTAAASAQEEQTVTIRAPHLASLRSLRPVGTMVEEGESLGTLELLDEEITLLAPAGGQIIRTEAEDGVLVEYDQPLVTLAPA